MSWAQAQIWADTHPSEAEIDWLVYPRACAVAEVVWSPAAGRDYPAFVKRLAAHQLRLAELGLHYRPLATIPAPRTVPAGGAAAASFLPGGIEGSETKAKSRPLFDGRTFDGWEGDTQRTFRIEGGAIVGGSLKAPVPHNDFLCTKASYANFILRAECKLIGPANGGIQFRSQRVPNNFEVSGYQADMSADPEGGTGAACTTNPAATACLVRPPAAPS